MKTAQKIIDRAQEMFFTYGIKSVTMDEIASELGISKKTLYKHVANKEDLLLKCTDRFIEQDREMMKQIVEASSDAVEEIILIARYIIQLLKKMKPTMMFDMKKYYRSCFRKVDDFHRQDIYQAIMENLQRGIAEGLYREDLNVEVIAKLYVGNSMIMSDETLFPVQSISRASLFEESMKYHIHGIAAAKGLQRLRDFEYNTETISNK